MKKEECYYIRFGEIPKNERSSIFTHLTDPPSQIGYELGVSAWRAINENSIWTPVYPSKPTTFTYTDFSSFFHTNNRAFSTKIFLISGTVVGYGSCGEPLLKHITIIKQLQPNEIMDLYIKKRQTKRSKKMGPDEDDYVDDSFIDNEDEEEDLPPVDFI